MSYLTRNLRQAATYWSPGTPDGFGGTSYGSPTPMKVRWEERGELFLDSAGQESVSHSIVYTRIDVEIGGYLFLGSSTATDPTGVSGALEIRMFRKIPSLRALKFERRATL